MMARPTTNMKEGWLCRTSYDEKNHEITHIMMTRDDPDRAMIQIQLWWLREIHIEWWSKSSSGDPDRLMIQIQWWWLEMIQIEWWSRSSPMMLIQIEWCHLMLIQIEWWSRSSPVMLIQIEWWSRSSDAICVDPDREMIQIQMTWRWRCLEDEDDSKTKMIQLMQRIRPVLKIVSKEYLPS